MFRKACEAFGSFRKHSKLQNFRNGSFTACREGHNSAAAVLRSLKQPPHARAARHRSSARRPAACGPAAHARAARRRARGATAAGARSLVFLLRLLLISAVGVIAAADAGLDAVVRRAARPWRRLGALRLCRPLARSCSTLLARTARPRIAACRASIVDRCARGVILVVVQEAGERVAQRCRRLNLALLEHIVQRNGGKAGRTRRPVGAKAERARLPCS